MSFTQRFRIKRRIRQLKKQRKLTVKRMATHCEMMLYTPKSQHPMIKAMIKDCETRDFPIWQEINRLEAALSDKS